MEVVITDVNTGVNVSSTGVVVSANEMLDDMNDTRLFNDENVRYGVDEFLLEKQEKERDRLEVDD